MKLLVALLCVACIWFGSVRAETAVQVQLGTSGFEFGFLYSDFYHVEAPAVQRCTTVISEADFLVALHLARNSDVKLKVIVDWRDRGLSWYEITHRCERTTKVYYVDLPADPGPPYGRAWGHWRKNRNKEMRMNDDEIRAFVQLQALSQHSDKSPVEVLRLRKNGHSPAEIAGPKHAKRGKSQDRSLTEGKSKKHGKSGKADKSNKSKGK